MMPSTQTVRLLNVAVLGPTMIAGGLTLYRRAPRRGYPRYLSAALGLFGALTMVYDAINYARHRDTVEVVRSQVTSPAMLSSNY